MVTDPISPDRYGGKLHLWRSIYRDQDGRIRIPYFTRIPGSKNGVNYSYISEISDHPAILMDFQDEF